MAKLSKRARKNTQKLRKLSWSRSVVTKEVQVSKAQTRPQTHQTKDHDFQIGKLRQNDYIFNCDIFHTFSKDDGIYSEIRKIVSGRFKLSNSSSSNQALYKPNSNRCYTRLLSDFSSKRYKPNLSLYWVDLSLYWCISFHSFRAR